MPKEAPSTQSRPLKNIIIVIHITFCRAHYTNTDSASQQPWTTPYILDMPLPPKFVPQHLKPIYFYSFAIISILFITLLLSLQFHLSFVLACFFYRKGILASYGVILLVCRLSQIFIIAFFYRGCSRIQVFLVVALCVGVRNFLL